MNSFEGLRHIFRDAGRVVGTFFALLRRPALWLVAVRQLVRMAPPRWWRRAPFLPLPAPGYLRFRLETAYGAVVAPRPADVIAYLEWCAAQPRPTRRLVRRCRPSAAAPDGPGSGANGRAPVPTPDSGVRR